MVPLFAPERQNTALREPLLRRIQATFSSGVYVQGPEVEEFEKKLAAKLGWRYAVSCSSGSSALVLALKALALEPGSQVITPAFASVASASAVAWAGLTPVFADVCPETGWVTVETVKRALTPYARAVLAVDLYGRQAPIEELRWFCHQMGLFLIEDGTQAIGVPSQGEKGAHLFVTSFHPTQLVGAIGDGGAVLSQEGELATRVRELSIHGSWGRDLYSRIGTGASLDAIQAAILSLKLERLESWLAQRRTIAAWYARHLKALEERGFLRLPLAPEKAETCVWSLYTILVPHHREKLQGALSARGIGCRPFYPKILPEQPAFRPFGKGDFPGAHSLAREVLSLPIYPELSVAEFETVVRSVASCVAQISI